MRRPGAPALSVLPAALRGMLCASLLFAGAAAAQPTDYIAFGDSITEGFGDDETRPALGYPPRLEALLNGAGENSNVFNHGLGGERTPEGLTRIDGVLAEGGDVLLLMEGSNDVSREISDETTRFNLSEMARKAEALGFSVVHATTIPRIPWARVDTDNVANQRLNEQIRDLAGVRERQLVDNFEVYGTVPDRFSQLYLDDPTDPVGHPNPAGYDLMAQTFFEVLTGADTVPPVTGLVNPRNGQEGVAPASPIVVDLWDFGEGIDAAASTLVVGGQTVTANQTGGERRLSFTYQPPQPLSNVVRVGVRSQDQASPANTVDREIARFIVAGTVFLDGDFDRDGRVTGADLVELALAFGSSQGQRRFNPDADFNGDGEIDGDDLAVLAGNFGTSSF